MKSGDYVLNATLYGAPISGFSAAPKVIQIFPGDTSPQQSSITGVPYAGQVSVGVVTPFLIIARDKFGNQQRPKLNQLLPDVFEIDINLTAVDPLTNAIVPPLSVDQLGSLIKSISVTDLKDGTFRVLYSTRRAGYYAVR
eukprot:scaffold432462_cov34-Prasinocladus_malaysianus.AAC.1